MCGIAGLLQTNGQPVDQDLLARMTDALTHRGPDGQGLHVAGPIGLGHRRLSIIDLEGGAQPIANEDQSIWVTFNGEIYNYRELHRELTAKGHQFRTHSDTEVLVHGYEEWGPEFVRRLRGMFAFGIWDSKRRRLMLARDRVGIKPLVWTLQKGRLAFASELQALRLLPSFDATINVPAIDLYLHYQYIPAPYSIYQQVHKLEPAHYLIVDADGRMTGPTKYWELPFRPDRSLDEAGWIERIDAALAETVKAHLVADVPFGAFLSGGLDSSTVVAYMSRVLKQPVQAFTIGNQVASYDERSWAEQAAKAVGADFHLEVVEPNALELLPKLVRHYGEPFADSSAIPTYYVSQLARRHVKMVLSGDGGDELFCGYHAFPSIYWEHLQPTSLGRRLKHLAATGARSVGLWPQRISVADSKYQRTAVIEEEQRRSLWRPEHHEVLQQTRQQFDDQFRKVNKCGLIERLQSFDVRNYIPFDNLNKVDIASMCHGLEVRVPLLDHVFMETAAQVPTELKLVEAGTTPTVGKFRLRPGCSVVGKHLLKRNAERFFPTEFIHREKRGFEIPVKHWLAGAFGPELEDRLTGSTSPLRSYFDDGCVRSMIAQGRQNRTDAWKVWSLLVLQEWLSNVAPVN